MMSLLGARGSAVILVLTAMALFTLSDATSKLLLATLNPLQVAWVRYFGLMIVLAPMLAARPALLRTANLTRQLIRGAGILLSALFFMIALTYLPLADATVLVFVTPFFVTLLSILMLGEKVGWRAWIGVAGGFVGVLIVMRPGTSAFQPAMLLPLLSSAAWAVVVVFTRRLLETDRTETSLFYTAAVGFAVLTAIARPDAIGLASSDYVTSAVMVLSWCGAQWTFIIAYRTATASELAPYSYSRLPYSIVLGFVMFGTLPDGGALLGSAVIIASSIYSLYLNETPPPQK